MKIAPMLIVLALAGSLHAKPVLDTVEAFAEYHGGKPVAVQPGRDVLSLGEMVESRNYTTREILRALQLVQKENRKDELSHLRKLYEIHYPKSFVAIYGEQSSVIRGDDVDGRLSRIIMGLILEFDFENTVKQIDLSPSAHIRTTLVTVRDGVSKLLTDFREGKFGKDSPETKSVSAAVRTTLEKLDSVIEEDYKRQPGFANLSPPPGTPNAAAGMSPDAIGDPELRRQYLATVENERKKQWKNNQQSGASAVRRLILTYIINFETFPKGELVDQFTNEGKSRELLRERISPEVKR